MSEWIDAKQSFPDSKKFLVSDGQFVCMHGCSVEENVSGEFDEFVNCLLLDRCNLLRATWTHWMPLPQPPKHKYNYQTI